MNGAVVTGNDNRLEIRVNTHTLDIGCMVHKLMHFSPSQNFPNDNEPVLPARDDKLRSGIECQNFHIMSVTLKRMQFLPLFDSPNPDNFMNAENNILPVWTQSD